MRSSCSTSDTRINWPPVYSGLFQFISLPHNESCKMRIETKLALRSAVSDTCVVAWTRIVGLDGFDVWILPLWSTYRLLNPTLCWMVNGGLILSSSGKRLKQNGGNTFILHIKRYSMHGRILSSRWFFFINNMKIMLICLAVITIAWEWPKYIFASLTNLNFQRIKIWNHLCLFFELQDKANNNTYMCVFFQVCLTHHHKWCSVL